MNTLSIPNLTIWAACWSGDEWMFNRTIRVLLYCARIFPGAQLLMFTATGKAPNPIATVQIDKLDWPRWSMFVNQEAPKYFDTKYALCVHEDGFPIDLEMWSDEFLEYDYVGAPWDPAQCGGWPAGSGWGSEYLVGNGGFFLQSARMLEACQAMPITPEFYTTASDVYVCRLLRKWFEDQGGIRFAPPEVAARFSTEQTHKACPSFGFHGRRDSPIKYEIGWKLIEQSEK